MHKYKEDVAVLLIFFCRDKQFGKVFEEVKKARPARLYLYQDGARKNRPDDIEGIKKCREIAEQIDWECEVHKWYQEENVGCDPSEYLAQKWMFETEEKGIILEDDDVPSQTFFKYCKELLDRYENDERIAYISGLNHMEVSENIEADYFFSLKGSIWGWATWKRFVDTWDSEYKWLIDEKACKFLRQKFLYKANYLEHLETVERHKASGKEHYESILSSALFLNGQLAIVPKYNMISNIGVGGETTHSVSDVKFLPKDVRKLINMQRYEIDRQLVHPTYFLINQEYEKVATITKTKKIKMRIESVLLRVRYGDFSYIFRKIVKR